MNCLLLLAILFCCGQSSNTQECCIQSCSDSSSNDNGCSSFTAVNTKECGNEPKADCGCSSVLSTGNGSDTLFPPSMNARTQYPYLEPEPHTCGCEEKK